MDDQDDDIIDKSPNFETLSSLMKEYKFTKLDVSSTVTIAPELMKKLDKQKN